VNSALRLVGVAAGIATAGCTAPYDHTQLVGVTGSEDATVSSNLVNLPVGAVVEVQATPMSASGPLGGDFSFNLVSEDTSVLVVKPAIVRQAGAFFVIFGVNQGTTQIEVLVDGQQQETPIEAVVTP
jgi:hypothetical protein